MTKEHIWFIYSPSKKDTQSALKKAFSFGRIVIIEEYVKGRELTVPIIDNNSYPILEIKPANEIYDYKCKYTPGMCEYVCTELDSSVEKILQKSTEHLLEILIPGICKSRLYLMKMVLLIF